MFRDRASVGGLVASWRKKRRHGRARIWPGAPRRDAESVLAGNSSIRRHCVWFGDYTVTLLAGAAVVRLTPSGLIRFR
jgi:hypothetical protein